MKNILFQYINEGRTSKAASLVESALNYKLKIALTGERKRVAAEAYGTALLGDDAELTEAAVEVAPAPTHVAAPAPTHVAAPAPTTATSHLEHPEFKAMHKTALAHGFRHINTNVEHSAYQHPNGSNLTFGAAGRFSFHPTNAHALAGQGHAALAQHLSGFRRPTTEGVALQRKSLRSTDTGKAIAEDQTKPKHVIRKGGMMKDEYLQADNTFGAYKSAKRFSSGDRADAHAKKHLGHLKGNYGVFPVSIPRQKQVKEAATRLGAPEGQKPKNPGQNAVQQRQKKVQQIQKLNKNLQNLRQQASTPTGKQNPAVPANIKVAQDKIRVAQADMSNIANKK